MGVNEHKKNICFVTGTRADFGKLLPLARAAQSGGFGTSFFVTGMHMLDEYGATRLEVQKSFFGNMHSFVNQRFGDHPNDVFIKTQQGFADFIAANPHDLVVVHGDRVEAFAVALSCNFFGVRCAHIEGGEVSGTIDEAFRHCVSKLAHRHFVANADAAARVGQLGEAAKHIYNIGSPEVELHLSVKDTLLPEALNHYNLSDADFGICIFHPVHAEQSENRKLATAILSAINETGRHFILIKPNNDLGASEIESVIREFASPKITILPSMRFEYFSAILRAAKIVVGNSSLGVREAPIFGIASVDVGSRQSGRVQGDSITHLSKPSAEELTDCIRSLWGIRFNPSLKFGDGSASKRFVTVLKSNEFWVGSTQKSFVDMRQD